MAESTDSTITPAAAATGSTAGEAGSSEAKARFAKALEEAKAGAQALGKEAQDRAGAYKEKLAGTGNEWIDDAKAFGDQAKTRAADLATQGKAKASEGLAALGSLIADNAPTLDEKVGPKYGDYARTAAQSLKDTASSLDAKDFTQLGDDAKEFVRKSPALALGMAAVAGFVIARLFKGSED